MDSPHVGPATGTPGAPMTTMMQCPEPLTLPKISPLMAESPDANLIALELECEKIARDLRLPPCPTILQEFGRIVADENADQRGIAALIGMDIALAAGVLKTVNSPAFGLRRETTSLQHAISIIGLRHTASLIARMMLRQTFSSKSGRLMQKFWDDSAVLTQITDRIAPQIRTVNAEEMHTYILFRNAGQAVMINRYPDYADMADVVPCRLALNCIETEQQRFAISHNQIGYLLAKDWHLPEVLALAIFFHHDSHYFTNVVAPATRPIRKYIAFGFLVDQIAALERGEGVVEGWDSIEAAVLQILSLSSDDVVRLAALNG